MNILLLTPVERTSRKGNRITTDRWERLLTELGHSVDVRLDLDGPVPDVLLALHARRSAGAVEQFSREHPDRPIVLALTGTDVYRDIHEVKCARESLDRADRMIVLQPEAIEEVPSSLRDRVHVVYQSIDYEPEEEVSPMEDCFEVSVIGHLRSVKDPFRVESASWLLPDDARVRIHHVGGELEEGMAEEARRRARDNPRYRWLGEKPREETLKLLARSRVLVHSSVMEGGAHVISEAIACRTAVLASDIPGNRGLLGASYPGFFALRDEEELAELMLRAERDEAFLDDLEARVSERRHLVDPENERRALAEVLSSL